ncbi:prenyltransferase [bacterium]|nr:prenyltransferase [bacterium]
MNAFFNKFSCWLIALRVYSLPISIMSWFVPFLYGQFDGGNFVYGIIALIGVVLVHLGANLFDDIIDYTLTKRRIDNGLQDEFNFQHGKCICLFDGSLSLKQYFIACFILFLTALIIALFFVSLWGVKLIPIIVTAAILCLLYPILGSLGFGEIIIAIIFSPLLYSGTYFVMTGKFSSAILFLSVPTGLLSVAVLHTHMLLDYKFDSKNRKITLCRLSGSQNNAYILLCLIIFSTYLSVILFSLFGYINYIYMFVLLTLPTAYTLLKVMYYHIKNPEIEIKPNIFMGSLKGLEKVDGNQRGFLMKFFIVRNLLSLFTLLLSILIVIEKCIL